MKNLLWSILAIASFFAIDLKAQTIRYKQTKLVVADVSRFLGSDDKYHYYSYDFFSSNYTQFEIANLSNHKTIEVKLGNETEGKPQLYFLNKKIYILRTDTKKEKDSKNIKVTFQLNPKFNIRTYSCLKLISQIIQTYNNCSFLYT